MHEMSIAQSLVRIIEQEMAKNHVSRLYKVKICYGRIAAIVPEALDTAFQALTRDTPMQGAVLETREVPLQARCRSCAREFTPEDDLFIAACPHCGTEFGHEIISGKELYIEELEAE